MLRLLRNAQITHFCSPMAVRVYDEETGALLHQTLFPTASSYHTVVSSCYGEYCPER